MCAHGAAQNFSAMIIQQGNVILT